MAINKKTRLALAAVVAIAVGSGLPAVDFGSATTGSAWAQSNKNDATPKRKTRRVLAVSQTTGQRLAKIQIAIEEKDLGEALELIDGLLKRRGLNSYEVGMVHYHKAWLSFEQDDIPGAIRSYQAVLQQDGMPVSFEDSIRYSLAQLYFSIEEYRKSLELLDQWIKYQEAPSANAYIIKGQAHMQLDEYRQALAPVQSAIQIHKDAGLAISENWYQLLKIIYYEAEDIANVRDILELLVLKYPPKASTWLELASAYGALKDEPKQLATMEIAYSQGYLEKESYLVTLAQLYMYNEAPIKAAWVLEKALEDEAIEETEKNFDLYSQALVYAKEYEDAIAPLGEACNLSDEGELCVRLGYVYLERDNWTKAIESLKQGLDRGGVKRPDQARITLCTAYYNADRLQDALTSCREARKDPKSRKNATTWITFLQKEISRRKQLRDRM